MPDQLPDRPDERHPIVAGLLALAGVGLAVGLVLAVVVIVGTKVLGLGNGGDSSSATDQASMYLPTPVKTSNTSGPQITLLPQPDDSPSASLSSPATKTPSKKASDRAITLSASTTQAGPMQQFQLTGIYPLGEGAILTVQRFESGSWRDFPATGSVSGETFQIPVQASKQGVNKFRVVDSDTGVKSNVVRVTIG